MNDMLDVEAIPLVFDSVFESPEKQVELQKNNLIAMPAVSGFFDDDDEDGQQIEVLYDDQSLDDAEELDTEANRKCLQRVKDGVKTFYNLYWDLSRDIYQVNAGRLYRLIGYKTFDDWVTKELDFTKRKADYLINIYKYYNKTLKAQLADQPDLYNFIIDSVKTIGWTKAEKIARRKVLNAENAKNLLTKFTTPNEKGKLPSVPEIEKIVGDEYHAKTEEEKLESDEQNTNTMVPYRFSCSIAQSNFVMEALDIAKGICPPGAKSSTHFSWICAEFATSYSLDRGKEVNLKTTMAKFESLLDVDIEVKDRVSGKVLYGADAKT